MAEAQDGWLAEQEALEPLPEWEIKVELQPRRWHVVVLMLRNQLIEAADRFKAVEKAARRTRHTKSGPDFEGAEWQAFVDRGTLLVPPRKAFALRVTPGTYERALAILNALCFAAEDREFFVSLSDEDSRVLLTGHGGEVEVRMAERLDQKFRIERNADQRLERMRELTPTGVLRLFVCGSFGSESLLGDLPKRPLETTLNEVFLRIYRQVVKSREGREEREALERRQATVRDPEEASWHTDEQCRRRELLNEVRQWQDAELIRSYVTHLLKQAPETLSDDAWVEWRNWALQVAAELDPTEKKLKGED